MTPEAATPPGGRRTRVDAAARLAATTPHGSSLDRLCELAATLLDMPAAHIALVTDLELVIGEFGEDARVAHANPAEDSLCGVTVQLGEPLAIVDARDDDRARHLSPVGAGIIGTYLGVPLLAGDGLAVGTICVHGPSPREWSEVDIRTLRRLAVSVAAELELAALSSDFEDSQLTWRLAADSAGVGVFDWDVRTGDMRWDDRLLSLFGFAHADFSGRIEMFYDVVHPDDLPRVMAAIELAMSTCGDYAAEYRISLPDGGQRWIGARGRAIPGEDGAAARLLGAAYDTTAVREGEARVARLLETMPTAFIQLDHEWRFTFLNFEAERMMSVNRDALTGQVLWEAFPGTLGTRFEQEYRNAVATGSPAFFDARYVGTRNAWYEVRAWPSDDGLAVYFVDVTEQHRSREQVERNERRRALVALVTQQLSGTLDLEEAVSRLGSLVVPEMADWCVATLVTEREREGRLPTLRDVGGWHSDPEQQPWVERFAEIRMDHLCDVSFLPVALETDRPLVGEDAGSALRDVFDSTEVHELLDRLEPCHVAVVPLRGHDRVVGLLTVFRSAERGPFRDDDIDTLAEVAAGAGLALDNARLFAEQRELAEGLQRSLLTPPPQPEGLEIAVRYEAAAETAQVGGDWYDAFVQTQGDPVLVIGDVVGHDTAAAAAMGQLRGLLRAVAVFSGGGPGDVLRGVDHALRTLDIEATATAVVARLEQTPDERRRGLRRLRWSNAGHPQPVVLHADGSVEGLERQDYDLLLGLDAEAERLEHEVVLEEGATVLLFTDGLVERRGEDLDTGLERLCRELTDLAEGEPCVEDLCDQLLQRMAPSRREDDIALVAVRLKGPRPQPSEVDRRAARFEAEPESVPKVRKFVRDLVMALDEAVVEDVALCVTELATNAVRHGEGREFEVSVLLEPEAVTVAVADDGAPPTPPLEARPVAHGDLADQGVSGRGLTIVASLADAWGVDDDGDGKRVWARLSRSTPPA
ncbi:SpoIIE family protein phosphatase [Nocardioides sp.]|uniref:SpoIIE family protein phosphatase n=1 Tax=Nocardioides sp. TaxID=35761 RepID=UPI002B26A266|nr:SpoIIE family protein phosphatase [Nocardioides sp.]